MFIINKTTNRITPVTAKTFTELGFAERNHLQEWLANHPSALGGEELLIIQKEFAGFDDTRERLDLLALDKNGHLVVIENKLDDSGRDVVWQVIKYASYCASLTKAQIVDIYQQYLNRYEANTEAPQDATERICEFLEAASFDEVKLNTGNSQRLIMVAADFRKEVTSTALWLLAQGVNVQCFKVTPYEMGEQLFMSVDQVIPTPEAKELMIGISAKEADEKESEVKLLNSQRLRLEYWGRLVEVFQQSSCHLFNNISPSKDHWLSAGSGVSGCNYQMYFLQKELVVLVYMQRPVAEENKFLFDFLHERKEQIETTFGDKLEWMRLDDKKASRINFRLAVDGYDQAQWSSYIQWHLEHMTRLEQAFKQFIREAGEALRDARF